MQPGVVTASPDLSGLHQFQARLEAKQERGHDRHHSHLDLVADTGSLITASVSEPHSREPAQTTRSVKSCLDDRTNPLGDEGPPAVTDGTHRTGLSQPERINLCQLHLQTRPQHEAAFHPWAPHQVLRDGGGAGAWEPGRTTQVDRPGELKGQL